MDRFISYSKFISKNDYEKYYGLPYDSNYSWSDKAIYCSELVAKILGIKPSPMRFDADIWGEDEPRRGELGISPDEIYDAIINMGYEEK